MRRPTADKYRIAWEPGDGSWVPSLRLAGVLTGVIFALLLVRFGIEVPLAIALALGLIAVALVWPEAATLTVVFILFTNLAALASIIHGVPTLVASSFSLLLILPLVHFLIIKREKVIIDQIFLLMLVFLSAALISGLFAKDVNLAMSWILNYVIEGLLLYLLLVNVIRKTITMKHVIWVLIFAGAVLGAMALYQDLTKSYGQSFGGLASRRAPLEGQVMELGESAETGLLSRREKVSGRHRAGGPFENPNRFSQLMLIFLPLAVFSLFGERSFWRRAALGTASALILSGILLSYSRAAFLTLLLFIGLMTVLRYVRARQLLLALVGLGLLVTIAAPGYIAKMESLRGVEALFSEDSGRRPDPSTRSRVTEMIAALHVFIDHPIIGVGPRNYTPLYSAEYHTKIDNALRYIPKNRRAHTLYFELGAETGILGLTAFLAIVGALLYQLWYERRRLLEARPELANMATAFMFSVIGFLSTSVFASLAYQRIYWGLLALAGAMVHIMRREGHAPRSDVRATHQ